MMNTLCRHRRHVFALGEAAVATRLSLTMK
jgi:hypothetical protein